VKRRDPLSELPEGVTTLGDAVRKAFEGYSWFPNELIPVMLAPACEETMHAALDTLMRRHQAGQLDSQEIQVSVTFFGTVTHEPQNEASRRHFVSWVSDYTLTGKKKEEEREHIAQLYIPLKRLADSLQNRRDLFE